LRRLHVAGALLAALAVGCAALAPPAWRAERADRRARAAGFARAHVPAGDFVLTAYRRHADEPGPVLTVYLEGDGRAWSSRHRPSPDPTPVHPVGLELALVDPAPAVVYLARPCQYTPPDPHGACGPAWWTDRRFAPEVVAAVSAAADREKRRAGSAAIELVGFSGGGVLAALLAARREDVRSLVTVAAPLDLGAWVTHHGLAPLRGSLDPAAEIPALSALPQVHLAGGRDEIVPPALVRSWVDRHPPAASLRLEVVPRADHLCCWSESWAERVASLRAWLREQKLRRRDAAEARAR